MPRITLEIVAWLTPNSPASDGCDCMQDGQSWPRRRRGSAPSHDRAGRPTPRAVNDNSGNCAGSVIAMNAGPECLLRSRLLDGQLSLVEVEVLSAEVVDLEQAHLVREERVPVDGEVHAPRQGFVSLVVEVAV